MNEANVWGKCPHCESGCGKCDEGKIVVTIPDGPWMTEHCDDCGHNNGGCLAKYATEDELLGYCIACKGTNTRYIPMEETL